MTTSPDILAQPSPHSQKTEEQTPLMKQYWELKSQVNDALLLFRMGDFYELFGEDAKTASEILNITLTSRDKNKPNPLPMAGVPHHSIGGYIQRLLKAGKKIAFGEQVEDPDTVKAGKIVRREITRVLTPAIQFDAEGSDANYLACIVNSAQSQWVLICLDVSTGEVLISQPSPLEVLSLELQRLPIKHFLRQTTDIDPTRLTLADTILIEDLPKNYLSFERAEALLKKQYGIENLEPFLNTQAGILGLGITLTYALRTQQQETLLHLQLPTPLYQPKTLLLGPNTAIHLDLPELFTLINKTRSTLGSRQLKRWLMAPLKNHEEIAERQKAILELAESWTQKGEKTTQYLSKIYDLERICGRINTKLSNPRDTYALGQSLASLKQLNQTLAPCQAKTLTQILNRISDLNFHLQPLIEKITKSQKEDAPLTSKEGGIFNKGTTAELDRLISLTEDGQKWLIDLENRERELTGIPSLKVRYNRVFGYYIEITQSHLKNVPDHYQRKQTMVGAERFFTDELKKFEEEILTASVRQKSLETELFGQLIEAIQAETPAIMEVARILGELDSLLALSQLSRQPGWCFPTIDDSLDVEITGGRHPVVDMAKKGHFVPNNLHLSPNTRQTLVITGPNMGGKSTVMRQNALIVILGQIGAPVPAQKARWGVFSSLYTRIGAQDAISKGQSTFMVEMSELAHILHHADERSLIILDEIGRGTSTYDGISVAWATLEWICNKTRARTLFSTHYHELIRLSSTLPLLANTHMAVESGKKSGVQHLRFLYELREGPTNESFGIHVAQIAGLPKAVTERAWSILKDLESNSKQDSSSNQLSLFDLPSKSDAPSAAEEVQITPPVPVIHPAMEELKAVNLNEMTPLQGLNFLQKLQSQI